jgi:hypothetical protein
MRWNKELTEIKYTRRYSSAAMARGPEPLRPDMGQSQAVSIAAAPLWPP